jgi:hypothetical protein
MARKPADMVISQPNVPRECLLDVESACGLQSVRVPLGGNQFPMGE